MRWHNPFASKWESHRVRTMVRRMSSITFGTLADQTCVFRLASNLRGAQAGLVLL